MRHSDFKQFRFNLSQRLTGDVYGMRGESYDLLRRPLSFTQPGFLLPAAIHKQ